MGLLEYPIDDSIDHVMPIVSGGSMPILVSPMSSPKWPIFEEEELARRHSLSLLNRTPPEGSLAAQLLGYPQTSNLNVPKAPLKSHQLLDNVRELAESVSEFNSCISSGSSSEESDYESAIIGQNNKPKSSRQLHHKNKKRKNSSETKVVQNKSHRKLSPNGGKSSKSSQ